MTGGGMARPTWMSVILGIALALVLAGTAFAQVPAVTQEVVDNPYGMAALWQGGDWVARGTLIALLIMSVASWYVLVTKLVDQIVVARQAGAVEGAFWRAPTLRAALDALDRRSVFRAMVEDGVRAAEPPDDTLLGQIDRESAITLAVQRSVNAVTNRLQRGLAVLATVGSTAPFVGLFGTVWGIYHALTAIGIAGQASIDKVAGPVGEALIMTAMGLAVAVPAVLGYNWMIRRNKVVLDRVKAFSADLHALLQSGGPLPAAKLAKRSA
jgi:biopolymer transport protein ExbB